MNRRDFSKTLGIAGLTGTGLAGTAPATAQGPGPVEGRDYTRVDPPQPAGAPGKIEVLEFFSFACPHCYAFEPTLEAWSRQLPRDVSLKRVPVPFLMNSDNFEHAYYALESMGLIETMQLKVFTAIHAEHQRLEKPEDIAAFVAKNGGDSARFLAAFKSFSVQTSAQRAKKMTADYKIDSVPSLVVQGRYVTSPSIAGGAPKSLGVVDQLVDRVRRA